MRTSIAIAMRQITISSAVVTVVAIAAISLQLVLKPPFVGDDDPTRPAPLPKPNCITSCGGVEVPYPFGIGPDASCYLPGFNLICDTTTGGEARLLIGGADGPLQVIAIGTTFLTVQGNGELKIEVDADGNGSGTFTRGVRSDGLYTPLSVGNELVLTGCNVQAAVKTSGNVTVASCTSPPSQQQHRLQEQPHRTHQGNKKRRLYAHLQMGYHGNPYHTDGWKGSCMRWCGDVEVPYPFGIGPSKCYMPGLPRVLLLGRGQFRVPGRQYLPDRVTAQFYSAPSAASERNFFPPASSRNPYSKFVPAYSLDTSRAEQRLHDGDQEASREEARSRELCKSKKNHCEPGNRGYSCQCNDGYHGNPYVPNGCKAGGRAKSFKGTRIIIIVASGTGLVSLAVIAYFISYKLKHRRAQRLKHKYVQRNRRQLLQHLAPQRADIAEKMIITLEELEKATGNFDKAHEIGGGGHGTIYKGILSNLHVVAIKKPKMVNQKEIDEFINEVAMLSQINHRNIIKLYGCCLETEVPMLVYEFISKGTLHDHLHVEGPRSLSWDDRLRISIETAKSLSYLHSTTSIPIIHRDVKPANILLDDTTLTAKLADFGSSRYIPLDRSGLTTTVQGTLGYMDPMYFRTCHLTQKSDVYSFGVMLIEVMTRKKPFTYITSEGNGLVAHFGTLFAEGNLSQILDPQVMDEGGSMIKEIAGIAVACVKSRWEERPTMRQVELRLEVARSPKEFEANADIAINSSSTRDGISIERLTSRQYSLEEEYMLSARYPR